MSDTEEIPVVPMELGLRVDILDNEGIWNTGKIVDVSRDEEDMVEIKYDGWGDEYNEWIPLSAQRLAPLHMYTMVKKCWAKLTKWPWWPAFVVLRAPTRKSAADALNSESKIYVEFFDSYNEEKRSRCWMQKKNIASFNESFDERASKNIGKNFPAYVEGTQRALAGGSPVLFSGNGTLPIEFSSKYTEPLAANKQALSNGDEAKWFNAYRIFSNRYRVLYGYDFAKDSTKTLLAAQSAKGKGRANGVKGKSAKLQSANDEEEQEEDEDEVEVVETTTPVKRGRGRPPGKQAKKQPKQASYAYDEDEDEEEEKPTKRSKKDADEEYNDAGDQEEEEDNAEDEEEESPRGRRSSRVSQRKTSQAELTPTRRAHPRRAKDGDTDVNMGDDEEEDDFGDEGEDFNHYEYDEHDDNASTGGRGRSTGMDIHESSRDTSPEVRYRAVNASKKVHKRKALKELLAATSPQPVLASPTSLKHQQKVMRKIETVPLGAKTPSDQAQSGKSPTSMRQLGSQRKTKMSPSRLGATHKDTSSDAKESKDIKADEDSSLRSWLGIGTSHEGSSVSGGGHRAWSIQRWLTGGFMQNAAVDSKAGDA